MKRIISVFIISLGLSHLSAHALTCEDMQHVWQGDLSNSIRHVYLSIGETGPNRHNGTLSYTDDMGGLNHGDITGTCEKIGDKVTMKFDSCTVTLVDKNHLNISGEFSNVLDKPIKSSGTLVKTV